MIIGSIDISLYAPFVHSLKEKRMVIKSIISKVRNKFNVSIAEVDHQDVHQTIVIGIVCVTNSTPNANSILNEVLNYIEYNFETNITDYNIEIF